MAIEIDKESFEIDRMGMMRVKRRYVADSRNEALTGIPRSVDGLPLAGVSGAIWISKTDGRHVVDVIYEGIMTEFPDGEYDDFELITEEREMPIETYEPFAVLFEEYGAFSNTDTRRVEFPETLPKSAPSKSGSQLGRPLTLDTVRNKDKEEPNPFYGVTSYPVSHTSAVWRLVRKRVPNSLIKQERTVIDRLPAGFDYSGPKKNWYVRPLQKRKSGNAWTIEWSAMEVSEFKHLEALFTLQNRKA
jgi:hypothetical protein